jgi:hypothetical protein
MAYEWNPAPPTLKQRVLAALFLASLAFTVANAHFGWGLFGDYGWKAVIAVTLAGVVLTAYVMPSVSKR